MSDTKEHMRPVFIVKKDTMSKEDIARIEKLALLVVVESTEPDAVRLMEPPADFGVPVQAQAALSLFRFVKNHANAQFYKGDLMKWFLDVLMDEPNNVARVERVKHVVKK